MHILTTADSHTAVIYLLQLVDLHWCFIVTQSSFVFTLDIMHWLGFWQVYNDMYPPLYFKQNNFIVLKILCTPTVHLNLLSNPCKQLIILLSLEFCFFQNVIVGIIHYMTFSDWLLPRSCLHLYFLHVFSWLDSYIFLALNIQFSIWTTVCLSTHLLKNILVASKFWQLWIKLL